jgi:hypothetical protein
LESTTVWYNHDFFTPFFGPSIIESISRTHPLNLVHAWRRVGIKGNMLEKVVAQN